MADRYRGAGANGIAARKRHFHRGYLGHARAGFGTAMMRARLLNPQPDATTAARARAAFRDQFDAERLERGNQLHQGIHIAADDTIAGLHALDGRDGQTGFFGKLALVHAGQRAGGTHLRGSDHVAWFFAVITLIIAA